MTDKTIRLTSRKPRIGASCRPVEYYCGRCRKRIGAFAQTCQHCGAELSEETQEVPYGQIGEKE